VTGRRYRARRGPAEPADAAGREHHEPELDLERVVFFSDAVFAIAITLLVLELKVPTVPERATADELLAALRATTPQIFAWLLSFATIGLYWLAHWRRFRYVERIDERLAALNLVLLGLIAFIPFPTALMGEHGDLVPVVVLYAISLSAAGIVGPLSWVYAFRAGLVRSDTPERIARLGALRGFSVPMIMLGSLLLLPIVGSFAVEMSWLLILPAQTFMNAVISRGSARQ
jgi:uncharacterized membrane protein